MSFSETDFYTMLGVSRDADGATLKTAYRKLAMEYHPDRNPNNAEAETRFKAVGAAYEVLKDPQKRAAYDQYGHAAFQQGGFGNAGAGAGAHDFGDIGDIFETIFGSAFGGGGQQRARRGADLRYDMQIGLEEAFHGKSAEIAVEVSQACEDCNGSGAEPGTGTRGCQICNGQGTVRANQGFFVVERPCPTCHGRGEVIETPCGKCHGEGRIDKETEIKVDIPPGVETGTRIRLSGKGEAGPQGAPPGDLYIFMHINPHPVFEREGTTLATRVPISISTAALGGNVAIPDLDGDSNVIDIPAGIQTGKQLRVRGAGMPVLQGRGRGDLVVEILVETPVKLTKAQRQILQEFRDTETGAESPESQGFFDKIRQAFGG